MNDCIFCKIIKGDIPGYTIYEDAEFIAILDRFPGSIGHTLILPKNHVANIFEMEPQQAARLFTLAVKLSRALKEALGIDDLNILQNNGALAGQTVFHFHMHLIPRYKDDGVSVGWHTLDPSGETFDATLAALKKHLN